MKLIKNRFILKKIILGLLYVVFFAQHIKSEQTDTLFINELELARGCGRLQPILDKACEIELSFSQNATNFTADIEGSTTFLCDKFNQVFTVLDEFQVTISFFNKLFDETFTAIEQVQEDICNKFQQTWTILGCMKAQPVSQAQTISSPGAYCLTQDIEGTMTIDADCVVLDLNGFGIDGDGGPSVSMSDHTDILIRNGRLESASIGVFVDTVTSIALENIDFLNNAVGISMIDSTGILIEDCYVTEHTTALAVFNNCRTGNIVRFNGVGNTVTDDLMSFANCSCFQLVDIMLADNNNFSEALMIESSENFDLKNINMCQNFTFTSGLLVQNTQNINAETLYVVSCTNFLSAIEIENSSNLIFNACDISNNDELTTFTGIVADTCDNIFFNKTTINDNTMTNTGNLFAFNTCNQIIVQNSGANNNSSSSGDLTVLFGDILNNAQIDTAFFSENSAASGQLRGIDCNASSNIIVLCSQLNQNECNNELRGLSFEDCQSIQVDQVQTNSNGVSAQDVYGLFVSSCTDISIKNSDAIDNNSTGGDARGFYVQDSEKAIFDTCIANNNDGSTEDDCGYEFLRVSNAILKNSIGVDTGFGLRVNNSSNLVIKNNYFSANIDFDNSGIEINSTSSILIIENSVFLSEIDGIRLNMVTDASVIKNVSLSNSSNGITLISSSCNVFKHNICNDNTGDGIAIDAASNENIFCKNTTNDNTTEGVDNNGTNNIFFNNKSQQNGGGGTANYSGVPLIAVYDFSMASFTTTPTSAFDNISVVP